jgi:5-(carboxyamino)imidazole ribonucleotide synthase
VANRVVNERRLSANPILPGGTIGILGGGQLGRMMALAARNMGYRIAVLDPVADSPCGQVADRQIVGDYQDLSAALEFARCADVITYEFENVDADVVRRLAEETWLPQGAELLLTTQHRWREKRALQAAGAPVAPFRAVANRINLEQAVQELGTPLVVKTTRGGYDGKGQWRIDSLAQARALWDESLQAYVEGSRDRQSGDDVPLIAEAFVPFTKELSVIVVRNSRGETSVFPVAENVHRNHILHLSIVPARFPESVQAEAQQLAVRIAESLDAKGALAVEMFWSEESGLVVNELAPRPHNSGHYTMDACTTSQFEQHVRAVCNLPPGAVRLLTPVVMVNILGQHQAAVLNALPQWPDNWKLHLYGKPEARTNRKMGHVNVLCDDVEDGLLQIQQSGIW